MDEVFNKIRQHEGKTEAIPEAEIVEAERALGIPLPKSYKEFCRRVGSVQWPAYVDGPRTVVQTRKEELFRHGSPEFLVFFGSDGGELQYAFDTRHMFDGEYPITLVDLEEGYEDEGEPEGAGGGFAEWLSDLVVDAEAQERADELKDLAERLDSLLQPEVRVPRPWCPDAEEVAEAEERLGMKFPDDYRIFSTAFGPIEWPLDIVDATGIEAQRRAVAADGVVLPEGFVPFARSAPSVFGFQSEKDGVYRLAESGELEACGRTFFGWLEREVRQKRRQSPSKD